MGACISRARTSRRSGGSASNSISAAGAVGDPHREVDDTLALLVGEVQLQVARVVVRDRGEIDLGVTESIIRHEVLTNERTNTTKAVQSRALRGWVGGWLRGCVASGTPPIYLVEDLDGDLAGAVLDAHLEVLVPRGIEGLGLGGRLDGAVRDRDGDVRVRGTTRVSGDEVVRVLDTNVEARRGGILLVRLVRLVHHVAAATDSHGTNSKRYGTNTNTRTTKHTSQSADDRE